MLTWIALVLFLSIQCQAAAKPTLFRDGKYPDCPYEYLDLTVTYAVHAKTIWHEDAGGAGGYWGPGIDEPNGNGAVRGMSNTMLGYAMLANAMDGGVLQPAEQHKLHEAGLTRDVLTSYALANLRHIIAHHKSAESPLAPTWGDHWQSSLWIGAAGAGAMIIWNDVPPDVREGLKRVARREADRIAAAPPRTYRPGNTGAEENAWDMHACALAYALDPQHTSATAYWKALCVYAANTYSVPKDSKSDAALGEHRVSEIVTTANLFDDFTLDNHGFFHPDYVQVSGQHLGEASVILRLGDKLHGGNSAERFTPYEMHHVVDVWEQVLKPLLLPNGEFAFPAGNDWTYHCSMTQSYLAFIATALGDPVAAEAEKLAIHGAMRRRSVSPPGRILGDTNLEWWWEPLLIKRCSTALLNHLLRDESDNKARSELGIPRQSSLANGSYERTFPDSKIWVRRNAKYFVSASWGKQKMGVFLPFNKDPKEPLVTIPLEGGILPDSVVDAAEATSMALVMRLKDGRNAGLVCLEDSVVWLSPAGFRPLGIENHAFTGGNRDILSPDKHARAKYEETTSPIEVRGLIQNVTNVNKPAWMCVDDRVGLITDGEGWTYNPPGKLNRRSAAVDHVSVKNGTFWRMLAQSDGKRTAATADHYGEVGAQGVYIFGIVEEPTVRIAIVRLEQNDKTKSGAAELSAAEAARLLQVDMADVISQEETDKSPVPQEVSN